MSHLVVALIVLCPLIARAEAPLVAVDEVVKTALDATVSIDPKTPAGKAAIVAWIGPSTLGATKIREALAKTSLIVLDDHTTQYSVTITVEAPNKSRVTIVLGPSQGSIIVTPTPTVQKLTSKCVAIPAARHEVDLHATAINQMGESSTASVRFSLETTRMLDVDGDGIRDAFVPVAPRKNACPEDVSWRVFVMRGRCGHEVGTVGTGSLGLRAADVPLDPSGFRPMTFESETTRGGKGPIPELSTTLRTWAVVNGRYKKATETTTSGVCHHCSRWWCNAVKP